MEGTLPTIKRILDMWYDGLITEAEALSNIISITQKSISPATGFHYQCCTCGRLYGKDEVKEVNEFTCSNCGRKGNLKEV